MYTQMGAVVHSYTSRLSHTSTLAVSNSIIFHFRLLCTSSSTKHVAIVTKLFVPIII